MSEIFLENKDVEARFMSEEDFYLDINDLKFISCDGRQCDPTICLRTSCMVHKYWRNKKES